MAKTGDSYTISLGNAPTDWGEYRNPTNRNPVQGEGYIPIPRVYAQSFHLYNSNYRQTGLGFNEFYASSADGFLDNEILLAQGSSSAGDIYAKNFSVKGNLKVIGSWFSHMQANASNSVRVTFTSSTHVLLEII